MNKLSLCLKHVKEWMSHMFMKLNLDKTKILTFGSRDDVNFYDIEYSNLELGVSIVPETEQNYWVFHLIIHCR